MMQKILNILLILVMATFSFMLTMIVLVNSFEIVTHYDLPKVNAVTRFEAPVVLSMTKNAKNLDYRLDRLLIPSTGNRLSLSPVLEKQGDLYQLANKGHYVVFNDHPIYGVGDTLIYANESWRTIYDVDRFEAGQFLVLVTKSENVTYKILDVLDKPIDDMYLATGDLKDPILTLAFLRQGGEKITFIKSIAVSKERT